MAGMYGLAPVAITAFANLRNFGSFLPFAAASLPPAAPALKLGDSTTCTVSLLVNLPRPIKQSMPASLQSKKISFRSEQYSCFFLL